VTLDNIAENRFIADCSGAVTARAFVTVNLLIERFEMSVYYYYYYYKWSLGFSLTEAIRAPATITSRGRQSG